MLVGTRRRAPAHRVHGACVAVAPKVGRVVVAEPRRLPSASVPGALKSRFSKISTDGRCTDGSGLTGGLTDFKSATRRALTTARLLKMAVHTCASLSHMTAPVGPNAEESHLLLPARAPPLDRVSLSSATETAVSLSQASRAGCFSFLLTRSGPLERYETANELVCTRC